MQVVPSVPTLDAALRILDKYTRVLQVCFVTQLIGDGQLTHAHKSVRLHSTTALTTNLELGPRFADICTLRAKHKHMFREMYLKFSYFFFTTLVKTFHWYLNTKK